ncbi:MAG: hypothetical protein WAL52_21180 [Candidatus Sulfotelmatobacter sp.]
MLKIINSYFRETALPYGRFEPKFFTCTKSKAAFDELYCSFDTHARIKANEYVKVIGHDNEGMKKVFALIPVMVQNVNE